MDLVGAVVVVTGAGSGIGAALARRLELEGSTVVATDVDTAGVEAVVAAIGGDRIVARGLDVRDAAAIEVLVADVEADLGPIELFCSNAGIVTQGFEEVSIDEWQRIWEINVLAHVHAARAVLPHMLERGRGHLLQTASAAGLLTQIGSAPYSVTKHGAVALAEWLSITYGDRGIGVSVLCPQAVRTNMTAGLEGGGVAGVDGMLEPDDVADAAVEGVKAGRFLILPHPEVATYVQRKAQDLERWLAGMRRLQQRYLDAGGAS